jgi:hypothetical protein
MVAGKAIYGAEDIADAIAQIRQSPKKSQSCSPAIPQTKI